MVNATVVSLSDGGSQYLYALPNGSVMVVPTPPAAFSPLLATAAQLAEYDFPPRPSDATALADWTRVMQAYRSDGAPNPILNLAANSQSLKYAVIYKNWAGFSAGTPLTQNTMYVGAKGEMTVPSHSSGTCGSNSGIGIWNRFRGQHNENDLVQQGIECGDFISVRAARFRPFTEFANYYLPIVFCSQSSWTFAAGDVIYQNTGLLHKSQPGKLLH